MVPQVTLAGVSYELRSARPRAGHFFIRSQPTILYDVGTRQQVLKQLLDHLRPVRKIVVRLQRVDLLHNCCWKENGKARFPLF